MSEWINLQHERPEPFVVVMVTDGTHVSLNPMHPMGNFLGCVFSGDVTHWMQIPTLPHNAQWKITRDCCSNEKMMVCSNCGGTALSMKNCALPIATKFCPWCGSEMNEGGGDDNEYV